MALLKGETEPAGGNNVVLVGFMGSGKSTVGRLVAELLGYDFVDTDSVIEASHGPIPELFKTQGEAKFRQLEREAAQQMATRGTTVIATGGGTMVDREAASALAASGVVVWLDVRPETVVDRLSAAGEVARRPLLAGDDPAAAVERLMSARTETYGRYRRVDANRDDPNAVAAEIVALVATETRPPT